jgi:DNA polymerase III subunit epsilon
MILLDNLNHDCLVPMMRFAAIDVETANADVSSICQIGIVIFENATVVSTWQQLVNPNDFFDFINISIHQITEEVVKDSPAFPQIYPEIVVRLTGTIVVCHTLFDRSAITRATEKCGLPPIECRWLDSARVVRRAWTDCRDSGYGLKYITRKLGIKFDHHVAAEDARAAGEIILHAIAHTGVNLDEWLTRIWNPIQRPSISQEGNPDGPLYGEEVVFTGSLAIPRREAAELAASAGCTVAETVRKSTTILVVGDQDIRCLAGHDKSSKHRKAEKIITDGQPIRIIGEGDFHRLLKTKP